MHTKVLTVVTSSGQRGKQNGSGLGGQRKIYYERKKWSNIKKTESKYNKLFILKILSSENMDVILLFTVYFLKFLQKTENALTISRTRYHQRE